MKVKFRHGYPATIDGAKVGPFTAGQEYDLPHSVALKFIASTMCDEVLPPVELEPVQDQAAAE